MVYAGCRYGDRSDRCSNMAAYDCYDPDIQYECCDTCSQYNQTYALGIGKYSTLHAIYSLSGIHRGLKMDFRSK